MTIDSARAPNRATRSARALLVSVWAATGCTGEVPAALDAPAGSLDAGDPADALACSLVPQGGCPPGQACDVSGGETVCRDVTAAGREVSTCTDAESCAAGYTCIEVGAPGTDAIADASCLPFCLVEDDCSGAGSRCVTVDDEQGDVAAYSVCTQSCAPTSGAGTGCPASWGCHASLAGGGFTYCLPAGAAGQGEGCTDATDCQPGFYCSPDARECRHWCDVSTGSGCESLAGTSCHGFTTPFVVDGTEYGGCKP